MPRTVRAPAAPAEFRVDRTALPGTHRLLEVFPGLDRLPAFARLPGTERARRRLARVTKVRIAPGRGWMYVAPHALPEFLRRAGVTLWLAPDDVVVVGRHHLARSARLVLYMDILHELCHVLQRWDGEDLWKEGYRYGDRPTEIRAYRFAVELGREQGATEAFLRGYLRVEWIGPKEYRTLLRGAGVAVRGGRRPPAARARGRPEPAA